MKYILRLDDICPQMDYENFWKIRDICIDHNIKPVLGIIPYNKDPKFKSKQQPLKIFRMTIDSLLRKNGWEIAQHGHTHELTQGGGILSLHKHGEFPGLTELNQMKKIREGKRILEDEWGWKTEYFFPPAHAYDALTLKVLKCLGFKAILDGIGFYPWQCDGLYQIPQIWWRPSQLPIPFRQLDGTILICFHHNTMNNANIVKFDNFLDEHSKLITSVKDTLFNFKNPPITSQALNKSARLLFYAVKRRK